ncbi:12353_t:CDS:2 [Gigaspora rosea]|nr:12353_t:CDS:2 [Gigaspora rosea]
MPPLSKEILDLVHYPRDVQTWNVFYLRNVPGCTAQVSHSALSSELEVLLQKLPCNSKKYAKAISIRKSLKIFCGYLDGKRSVVNRNCHDTHLSYVGGAQLHPATEHYKMTSLLWKSTQQLADLTRINEVDKCLIHAVANAAINNFISADSNQINEMADLTRINDIDKEIINCVSIHAVANAAINNFISADSSQINEMADSNNNSDGLATRKHPLVQDELISIKRRQVGMKSSNAVNKHHPNED